MKMVIALISRGQIEDISRSLTSLGISGMTLSEVKCPTDEKALYKGVKAPHYAPNVKIEIAIDDDKVDQLVGVLSKEDADSNFTVDKICVLDIKESIRIRTGEKGDNSI